MKFILVIFLWCLIHHGGCRTLPNDTNTPDPSICDVAKRTYRSAGYEDEDINTLKSTEIGLKVCGKYQTCCKAQAELNLVKLSERKRTGLTSPLQSKLNSTFYQTGGKFKELMRSLITRSQESLDSMFEKTYGPHYENNRQVFKALYTSFHQYLNGSELDLQTSINAFFAKLHEKVYIMTKPWATFSKKYENCIYESTNFVKPFGIIQTKVQHQTYRSFLASRVFLQGLKEGMEVIMQLLQLPVHDECSIAFMKMTQCSICSSISESLKPCTNYCNNVMKGCFTYIIMIQPKWDEYIKEMVMLAEKLEGPFSLEAVVDSLGVKISEAIMVFQEHQANITAKIEQRCGKEPANNAINGRKRRSLDKDSKGILDNLKAESEKLLNGFTSKTDKVVKTLEKKTAKESVSQPSGTVPSGISFLYTIDGSNNKEQSEFERLLKDTKKSLNELEDYWILLPGKLCSMGISIDQNQNCWNGENTTGYDLPIIGNKVHDLFNKNPEMNLNPRLPNINIVNQAKKLDMIITRIRNAINGNAVVCVDCSESSGESGSASGVNPTDEGPSGSGEETTTTPATTVDPCENSVNEDCVDVIQTTTGPNKFGDDNGNKIPWSMETRDSGDKPKSSGFLLTSSVCTVFFVLLATLL